MLAVTAALFQPKNTAIVALKKERRPPRTFEESLARRAMAPLIPAPAKFANHASRGEPSQPLNRARPASTRRVEPERATSSASSRPEGIRRLRTKSFPCRGAARRARRRLRGPRRGGRSRPRGPSRRHRRRRAAWHRQRQRGPRAPTAVPGLREERVAGETLRGSCAGDLGPAPARSTRSPTRG